MGPPLTSSSAPLVFVRHRSRTCSSSTPSRRTTTARASSSTPSSARSPSTPKPSKPLSPSSLPLSPRETPPVRPPPSRRPLTPSRSPSPSLPQGDHRLQLDRPDQGGLQVAPRRAPGARGGPLLARLHQALLARVWPQVQVGPQALHPALGPRGARDRRARRGIPDGAGAEAVGRGQPQAGQGVCRGEEGGPDEAAPDGAPERWPPPEGKTSPRVSAHLTPTAHSFYSLLITQILGMGTKIPHDKVVETLQGKTFIPVEELRFRKQTPRTGYSSPAATDPLLFRPRRAPCQRQGRARHSRQQALRLSVSCMTPHQRSLSIAPCISVNSN